MIVQRAGVCQALIGVHAQCPFSGTGSVIPLPQERPVDKDCMPQGNPTLPSSLCLGPRSPSRVRLTLPEVT